MMKSLTRLKWVVVSMLACSCAAAWLGMAAGILWIKFSVPVWTAIVVSAAISTEALFWSFAAALGISAIQARHRIMARARALLRPRSPKT
jgi:hypothetical protein